MKPSQALYEAIEAVERLETAMIEDHNSPDTKTEGTLWIQHNHLEVVEIRIALQNLRGSLNEGD